MSTAYGYSVKSRDSHGLDASKYLVHIGVARLDGKALTAAELAAIETALAPAAAADDEAAASAPPVPAKPAGKRASKSTPVKTRKVTSTKRKAARRP